MPLTKHNFNNSCVKSKIYWLINQINGQLTTCVKLSRNLLKERVEQIIRDIEELNNFENQVIKSMKYHTYRINT